MSIFGNLELEKVVQVGDKTRLDGTKSFITKDEDPITLVEIEPETGAGFVDVTGTTAKDWWLDYIYTTSGTKTVSIKITTSGAPVTKTFSITALTEAQDNLFSQDSDLIEYEHDILKYVRPGRSSWKDFHRKAQEKILSWLDEKGYVSTDGSKLTKEDFVSVDDVRELSTLWALELIYYNLSNVIGDIFALKSDHYHSKMLEARDRAVIRMDLDNSGQIDSNEFLQPNTSRLLRR
jgi:hypothetical protein